MSPEHKALGLQQGGDIAPLPIAPPSVSAQAEFDDALSKAFAEIETAKKDSTNPHFRNKYADLASVTDAIRGPLTKNGFSWPQFVSMTAGEVHVRTELRRKGVCVASMLSMPVEKPTAQGVGSAITYARRYALSAITGVCPDDDDGTAASEGGKAKRPAKTRAKPRASAAPKASPQWTAAYGTYQKVAKRRADLLQSSGLGSYMTPADRVANALGLKTAPGGRDITPEQWEIITSEFSLDITDIEATLAEREQDAPTGEPMDGRNADDDYPEGSPK